MLEKSEGDIPEASALRAAHPHSVRESAAVNRALFLNGFSFHSCTCDGLPFKHPQCQYSLSSRFPRIQNPMSSFFDHEVLVPVIEPQTGLRYPDPGNSAR